MPINITISNSLKNLAAKFTTNLNTADGNVFDKDIIVTQTEGIKKWLSLFVSSNSTNGIFANFDFKKPNEFFDDLFKKLDSTYEDSHLQQGSMKWIIFDLLSGDIFKNDSDFKEILAYCGTDRVKLLRLSDKIADLFDQYFIYREKMIHSWNEGDFWDKIASDKYQKIEKWQYKIFTKLKERVSTMRDNSSSKFKDRVELKDVLFEQLSDENSSIVSELKKLKKVSFFGLSIITTYHYELIERIAEFVDCDFYLLNPSGEFWYDVDSDKNILKKIAKGQPIVTDKSENDFLANYGRSGQEFYKILFTNEQVLNNLETDLFDERFPTTLLGSLQESIFNVYLDDELHKGSSITSIESQIESDKSVQISSCYTAYREVEVFYDYILGLFDENSALKPSDVLVLIPDIESYAPYIEAIFSQNSGGKFIPFSIADKSYKGGDNPFDVMSQIIELSRGVCEAESVMSIVENRYITDKYGFKDYDKIREIIKAASIRWGIDRDQIDREGEFEFNRFNSWEFGLKRVIFGYAMQGDDSSTELDLVDDAIEDDLLPLDIVEGAEALDGLRLYALITDIQTFLNDSKRSRNLEQWKIFFLFYFDTFIALPYEETNYKQEFEKLLIYYSGNSFNVSFNVVRDDILKLFADKKEEGGFYSGSITFCSMVPMRSIPHKVVAMVGMGENDFPGRKNRITFDLMEDSKMVGDRDPKLSNRYLFLEAIVSASENLYLSYIGKSSKNSTPLNPSPAIDEFVSYIAEVLGKSDEEIKNDIISEYPLYGYGKKYREKIEGFETYIKDNDIYTATSTVDVGANGIRPNDEKQPYKCDSMMSLINFYKDAPKWFCNTILGIYFNEDEMLLSGEEAFDVDNLTNWSLKDRIASGEASATVIESAQKYQSLVQPGALGEVFVENISRNLTALSTKYISLTDEPEIDIDLTYKDVEGSVKLFGDNFVAYNVSSTPYKAELDLYIKHLFLCAKGFNGVSTFIHSDGESYSLTNITADEASQKIDELIYFVESSSMHPHPFDITTAGELKKPSTQKQDIKTLNTKLKNRFNDEFRGEYLNRMLSGYEYDEAGFEEFLNICKMVFPKSIY